MVILSTVITIVTGIALPLFILLSVIFKYKKWRKPLKWGIICFAFFQMAMRIPLLTMLSSSAFAPTELNTYFLVYAVFTGLVTALFEELGRIITMIIGLKEVCSTKNAIAFGIGNFLMELFLLVGAPYFLYSFIDGFTSYNSSIIYYSLERILMIPTHVFTSILVMHFIREQKPKYLGLAFLIHFFISTALTLIQSMYLPQGIIEAYILGFNVFICFFMYKYYQKYGLGEDIIADNDYSKMI